MVVVVFVVVVAASAKKQTVGFYLNSLMLSLSEDILKVVTK